MYIHSSLFMTVLLRSSDSIIKFLHDVFLTFLSFSWGHSTVVFCPQIFTLIGWLYSVSSQSLCNIRLLFSLVTGLQIYCKLWFLTCCWTSTDWLLKKYCSMQWLRTPFTTHFFLCWCILLSASPNKKPGAFCPSSSPILHWGIHPAYSAILSSPRG